MQVDKREVERLVRSYHWMEKEVARLARVIWGSAKPMRSWGVAQYGIEAAMPKGSSGLSHAELEALDIREERLYKRHEKLQEKVYAIEAAAEYIVDEQQQIIYDCMTEGMSYNEIGLHLGLSRENVRLQKEKILDHICQYCGFVQLLSLDKKVV